MRSKVHTVGCVREELQMPKGIIDQVDGDTTLIDFSNIL